MIIDSIHASQQDVDLVNKYVRNYLYTLESKALSLIEDEDEELIYSKILVFLIKENIEITAAVDNVLTGVIAKEQQESKKEEQKSTSSRSGEPCRPGSGHHRSDQRDRC